jgi:hypothetical protein
MKKSLCVLALALGLASSAQAQVHFASGSAQPTNSVAATKVVDVEYRAGAKARKHRVVTCRDGTRRIVRVCRRHHGGVR